MGNSQSDRCQFSTSAFSRCSENGIKPNGFCKYHGCFECGVNLSDGMRTALYCNGAVTSLWDKPPGEFMWRRYNLCPRCEDQYPKCTTCNQRTSRVMPVSPNNVCGVCK
jgi:hypothetical protein